MRNIMAALVLVLLSMQVATVRGQTLEHPPLSEYMMPQEAEVALAKSAAPQNISDHATIRILTTSGYKVVHQGDNGFVCMVMRGFTGAPTFAPAQLRMFLNYDPKTRAPICFDPQAVRTVLPHYDLRTKLGLEGKTPDQIAEAVKSAYDRGQIPKRSGVSFAYMWSADQVLGPVGHWHPHMMAYAPNYENSSLGNNEPGSHLPAVIEDAGTPFAVVVIPVDEKLFVKAQP
jgi:hypothetical protein